MGSGNKRMTIYVVRVSEWYKYGSPYYETLLIFIERLRCVACRKRLRYKSVLVQGDPIWRSDAPTMWCSEKCYHGGKIALPDKRNARSVKRRVRRYERENYLG